MGWFVMPGRVREVGETGVIREVVFKIGISECIFPKTFRLGGCE